MEAKEANMTRCEIPDESPVARPAPSGGAGSPERAKPSIPVAGLIPADILGAVEEAFGSEEGDFLEWLWPLSPLMYAGAGRVPVVV